MALPFLGLNLKKKKEKIIHTLLIKHIQEEDLSALETNYQKNFSVVGTLLSHILSSIHVLLNTLFLITIKITSTVLRLKHVHLPSFFHPLISVKGTVHPPLGI